jgi:hypothetical protein
MCGVFRVALIGITLSAGCSLEVEEMELDDLREKGWIFINVRSIRYPPPMVTVAIDREDRRSSCGELAPDASVTLNGVLPFSRSAAQVVNTEGGEYCSGPSLGFLLEDLAKAPGAPDGELVIRDPTHTIRVTVKSLAVIRQVTLLTDGALKPGSDATFRWDPPQDQSLRGELTVHDKIGKTLAIVPARAAGATLTVTLPSEGWPTGSTGDLVATAAPVLGVCEGVVKCSASADYATARFALPTP